MSSHSSDRSTPQDDRSTENGDINILRGAVIEALLREVRSALRAPAIRHFHPRHRRETDALARRIEAYLDRFVPTPLGLATVAAIVKSATSPAMIVDQAKPQVVATSAGVWIGAQLLVDWDDILPLLPAYANSNYAAAIAALPERERTVFLLHRMGGLILRDIAQKLGCDVEDCEQLLGKALGALARRVDGAV
jgi:hypothetical protein